MDEAATPLEELPGPGARIASRYRVEEELARGGMGVVYRVFDELESRTLALKRMVDPDHTPRLAAMFEREYRTLAALDHPRIIEVHAFGRDGDQPYYTMELLEGRDLRELAPLPYREACRYLRDVASSLALLHARRLLHRDLSPRNVRATSDGHCKLIDFGALATFGVSGEVVGTPPCIPPEALRGMPLDQRADLYSLGALAYWLLTRRHAYHARHVRELPEHWRTPPPPPSRARKRDAGPRGSEPPFVPQQLDELVMALLSQDPQARPRSAAEVIDRLNKIAGLDAEPLPDVALSYLAGARLVGREAELARLTQLVGDAVDGQGHCVAVRGPTGIGRTRLLDEVAIQGQVAGAVVLRADAAMGEGAYATTRELARQLLEAAPDAASEAARSDAQNLGRVSEELRAHLRLTVGPRTVIDAYGEVRKRTQAALRGWFGAVARELPMVMIVDNCERMDEASAAVITRLARDAAELNLLLVVGVDDRRQPVSPPALQALAGAAEGMRLQRLSPAQTLELARSLFGDTGSIKRFAQMLYDRTLGNPGACIALAEHLVQHGIVRHVDGAWLIPDEVSRASLPESLDDVFEAQLDQLSAGAQRLLEALSVKHGALPLDLCTELARTERVDDAFEALEELSHRGALLGSAEGYRFAQDGLRDVAHRRLDSARRMRLHLAIGRFLMGRAGSDLNRRLEAGFHLLEGGERRRGADILAGCGLELMYEGDEMPAAMRPLKAAVQAYREQKRSNHEMAIVLAPLAVSGYVTDLDLATTYGDESIAVQRRDIGLSLSGLLRPALGRTLSTFCGLGYGALRYVLRYGLRGPQEYMDAVNRFVLCCTSLAGAYTICLDAARARHFAAHIEPLRALGKMHLASITHDFTVSLAMLVEDRCAESFAGFQRIVEAFEAKAIKGMIEGPADMILGGAFYAMGALASFRGDASALRFADRLEGVGLRLYDMVAEQVRANFYANRGEFTLAEEHRQKVELHAIDAGSAWQAEVWNASAMINASLLCSDVLGVKRSLEQLQQLAKRIPSLEWMARLALGSYQCLRMDSREAVETFEAIHAERGPKTFIGWSSSVATQVAAHNDLGEHERALELADWGMSHLQESDLEYAAFTLRLQVQRARALAGVGKVEQATRELDRLIEGIDHHSPVLNGLLHEQRARVAALAGDDAAMVEHADRMNRFYRATGNPALIAICEGFAREHSVELEQELGDTSDAASQVSALLSYFHDCDDPQARADRALELLMSQTGAATGYLYAITEQGLRLLAPRHGQEPPRDLEPWLLDELQEDEEVTANTETQTAATTAASTQGRRVCLLQLPQRDDRIIAAAVLDTAGRAYTPPSRHLLDAIAQGVYDPAIPTVASG